MADEGISWFVVAVTLIGGLALFLLGLDQLTHAMKKLAGGGLRVVLGTMTANRISGALSGAVVTAAVNSSSVTTVLLVGFVSAGVLDLSRSVAVILGANIGSTVTAQLVAFDLGAVALAAIGSGFLLRAISRGDRLRLIGELILGLGMIFHGMALMGQAMVPLRSYNPFLELLSHMENPLLGALAGAVFTALVQSSAATTGIAITLAAAGVLPLTAGIALVLGANIGTCLTAIIAAIGKPIAALRVAVVHVTFNVIGVILWLPLIGLLAAIATWLAGEQGTPARQLANAHTFFNVINTLLFLPFTTQLARLATWLTPERASHSRVRPWHLDPGLLGIPPLAFDAIHQELGRLGDLIRRSLVEIAAAVDADNIRRLDRVERTHIEITDLGGAILRYLGRLRREDFTVDEGMRFHRVVRAARALEMAGAMAARELVERIRDLQEHQITVSAITRTNLRELGREVGATVKDAVEAVREDDLDHAERALSRKPAVKRLADHALRHLAETLQDQDPQRIDRVRLETAIIDTLRRLHDQARNAAKAIDPRFESDVEA